MKLYSPQVQLAKQTHLDGKDEYFLHAVTFCDKTYYQAAGHDPLPTDLDEDGVYRINLNIARDIMLPEFGFLTPVVHTIRLGHLPFEEDEGFIEVSITVLLERTDSKKKAGTVKVSSSSADEKVRTPVEF